MATNHRASRRSALKSRLHALFTHHHHPHSQAQAGAPPIIPAADYAKATVHQNVFKIRILTWNMHDSLPKGSLEELLGIVPEYIASEMDGMPALSMDSSHPFHIVVVAGQECPTVSGIPMGIGAGFKFMEKDKDREPEKSRSKDETSIRSKVYTDDSSVQDIPASGWTSTVEDWLCHGGGSPAPPTDPQQNHTSEKHSSASKIPSPKRKGPYQLLIKERLMGIYLAVYVHREVKQFVTNTSKSAVAAGLVGGRVGNKGGVGISIAVNGTTFLFLNAHLAAHEGKIHHRLHNLAKIKAELAVDDFLKLNDPRVMAEDVTDRFDYTFLFGDLNFRLDVSRMHADWLISRGEYTQALAFDQLANLMRNGHAFSGFNEAPIRFPPTFKYDVLRTLKKHRRRNTSKLHIWKHTSDKPCSLTEAEEIDAKDICEGGDADEADEDDDQAEAGSVASSVWTSVHSRPLTDPNVDHNSTTSPKFAANDSTSNKQLSSTAPTTVFKAKSKWLSIVTAASTSNIPLSPSRNRSEYRMSQRPSPPFPTNDSNVLSSEPTLRRSSESIKRIPSSRISSAGLADATSDDDDENQGVYDSSSKQRVPSWCDRILWKTTLEPDDAELALETTGTQNRSRTRVGQFIFNAFRPLSARMQRDSLDSSLSISTGTDSLRSPILPAVQNSALPFSRFASARKQPLLRPSRSHDDMNARTGIAIPRTQSQGADLPHRRAFSAVPPLQLNTAVTDNMIPSVANTETSWSMTSPFTAAPIGWRFFPFFSRADHTTTINSIHDSPLASPAPTQPKHHKGDVICLSYNTLDHRGMRKLEGRSDHFPVIGCYAAYV